MYNISDMFVWLLVSLLEFGHSLVEDMVLWNVLIAVYTLGLVEGISSRSRSHTCCPLWKTAELLLNYIPQVIIPTWTWRQMEKVKNQADMDLFRTYHFKADELYMSSCSAVDHFLVIRLKLWYLLLSFCTSRSSSSFSLMIKLCRTGISNLIYCATWWKRRKQHDWWV